MSEIVFELSALQYELMGFPGLQQGQSLDVVLDAGLLFPESDAASWYHVRSEPLPPRLTQVALGRYAFAGQIKEAEINKVEGDDGVEENEAILLVDCGSASLRVICAAQEDGLLPWGTWETRFLTGYAALQGIVEEDFSTSIGRSIGVTIWHIHRLVLTPGDPLFGQCFESDSLVAAPLGFDRVWIAARLHRRSL